MVTMCGAGEACSLSGRLCLANNVGVFQHFIMDVSEGVAWWHHSCLWVRLERPSEKKNERFWPVDLVVDPATRLLHAEVSPLLLEQETTVGNLLVNCLRQKHVSVLKLVVAILFTVLDLLGEMRHFLKKLKLIIVQQSNSYLSNNPSILNNL